MGFLIMGVIGYVVKLSALSPQEIPRKSILTRLQYIYPLTTFSLEVLEGRDSFWVEMRYNMGDSSYPHG